MSKEECLIAHTFCNMPEDPEKMKEHLTRMKGEIEELKINLKGTLRVLEEMDMYFELRGYAYELAIAVVKSILGC